MATEFEFPHLRESKWEINTYVGGFHLPRGRFALCGRFVNFERFCGSLPRNAEGLTGMDEYFVIINTFPQSFIHVCNRYNNINVICFNYFSLFF